MESQNIVEEIIKLPFKDQLSLVEQVLHNIGRQNFSLNEKAATQLFNDYVNDPELTVFTKLDFENFYETR